MEKYDLSKGRSISGRGRARLALAALIILAGGFLTFRGLSPDLPGHVRTAGAETLPSTVKPSQLQISQYSVAPTLPKYIDIPALNVHARVFSAGTDPDGSLASPADIYDTDWYQASAKPGQYGAVLIDGHSGIGRQKGIFGDLKKLSPGAEVSITRGDNRVFNYKVTKVQVLPKNTVDMASLLVSYDTGKPGLNLISCTGAVVPGTVTLDHRVLVYAVQT